MTKTIFVLSETAINQIAAGEVVEGPCSVVKELVENAVDAEATAISIEIIGGGHFLIEVSDNGKGMSSEDVRMSIQRFATSKISSLKCLDSLQTMGFRGEALAAISSVSKFSITSSMGKGATILETSGGLFPKISEKARGRGTTVRVESLFYNTPARKKFQKGKGGATTEIIKTIRKLALCHPTIAFYLKVDGEEVLTIEGDPHNRVKEVLGKDFFSPTVPLCFEKGGIRCEGVVASCDKTRTNRMGQFLVVNHRSVYSLLISNAVAAAFGTSLGKGEFPLFFLNMTFDPSAIDVNVHPQKKEIRFQNEEEVFKIIREGVVSALTASLGMANISTFAFKPQNQTAFKEFVYKERETTVTPTNRQTPLFSPSFEEKGFFTIKFLWDELCIVEVVPPHPQFCFVEQTSYVLIDLSLLEKLKNPTEPLFCSQLLLEPEEIFLTVEELFICESKQETFSELGVRFSIGKHSVVIYEMAQVAFKNVKESFLYTLSLLEKGESLGDIKEKIVTSVFCKRKYSVDEALVLIQSTDRNAIGTLITKKQLRNICKE